MTLRALAALLSYPSADLQSHIGEVREALASERVLPGPALERLAPLLQQIESASLLDIQAAYSDLFDRTRKFSLYLFEHVHGESRERGQAMVALGQMYLEHGYTIASNELPDFLPLFLEFASCRPAGEAQKLLAEPAHIYAALQERLEERGSAYAGVFHALIAAVNARPDEKALAQLRAQASESKSLDEEWEEAAVDFGRPQPANREHGVVARIRAAQIALASALRK
jgi:nitrate reductase delta subunit